MSEYEVLADIAKNDKDTIICFTAKNKLELEKIKEEGNIEEIVKNSSENTDTRCKALLAAKEEGNFDVLLYALQFGNNELRHSSMGLLKDLIFSKENIDKEFVDQILMALHDKSTFEDAIETLEYLKDERAVEPLVNILSSKINSSKLNPARHASDRFPSQAADCLLIIKSLKTLASIKSIKILLKAVRYPDIAHYALEALTMILKNNAKTIDTEDLKSVLSLKHEWPIYWLYEYDKPDYDGYNGSPYRTIERSLDTSKIVDLAEKELKHRK